MVQFITINVGSYVGIENLAPGVLTKRFTKNRINKCEVEMGWRMYVLCLRLAVCAAFDHDKKALRNKSKGFIYNFDIQYFIRFQWRGNG